MQRKYPRTSPNKVFVRALTSDQTKPDKTNNNQGIFSEFESSVQREKSSHKYGQKLNNDDNMISIFPDFTVKKEISNKKQNKRFNMRVQTTNAVKNNHPLL